MSKYTAFLLLVLCGCATPHNPDFYSDIGIELGNKLSMPSNNMPTFQQQYEASQPVPVVIIGAY